VSPIPKINKIPQYLADTCAHAYIHTYIDIPVPNTQNKRNNTISGT
jgi:hypothetical protein